MYSYIKGTLEEIKKDMAVVENHDIGYNISIPSRVIADLPPIGSYVRIYTYLHVREDIFSLFGFLQKDDLEIFKLLINVSGIGPKGALGLLSVMSADDIRFAVVSADAKAISKAPGIGLKTAQRLIIELKDRVDLSESDFFKGADSGLDPAGSKAGQQRAEAMEALTSLGYSASDAAKVLSGIEMTQDMPVEAILKEALKKLAFL